MSGDHYYFGDGDNVHMHGGTNNIGIVKKTEPAALSPELRVAMAGLTEQLVLLRAEVSPLGARMIDEALPVLVPDAAIEPRARESALMAVAGVAATAGTLGEPILRAVNGILQLLGVG
ncbi:hypothetical protein [Streptomyces sp. NBC_00102]|uniref:hypothetical protein n=1 Tax=Streptomyces sp. NBC_00102 TaxID=2975652 RepID=UPI00224E5DAB|nr:hypothetical protein [Streptomyces sp. NBC_00102]MCX5397250.1 hypothetical protein [Streptomyces sp. NBC_00102]